MSIVNRLIVNRLIPDIFIPLFLCNVAATKGGRAEMAD